MYVLKAISRSPGVSVTRVEYASGLICWGNLCYLIYPIATLAVLLIQCACTSLHVKLKLLSAPSWADHGVRIHDPTGIASMHSLASLSSIYFTEHLNPDSCSIDIVPNSVLSKRACLHSRRHR